MSAGGGPTLGSWVLEEPAAAADYLSGWLKNQVQEAGAAGLAVGLSGGIDSAVVAGLAVQAVGPEAVLGLILPCHSLPQDEEDAQSVARHFGVRVVRVDLGPLAAQFVAALESSGAGPDGRDALGSRLARANLKPRLRMMSLYYFANQRNLLVAGTGNRSELTVGYFTKYGDGGVDLLPLGNLVKAEVRALARQLGVPERVIQRAPSAGLWEAQTDEAELGLRYADLDRYLLTGEAPPELAARVALLAERSAHKRRLPPAPPVPPPYSAELKD